jgi:hypothetical protein
MCASLIGGCFYIIEGRFYAAVYMRIREFMRERASV